MDPYAQMAQKIIKAQEEVIGPVALEQAKKVSGLKVDWSKKNVSIEGDKKVVVENLIEKYEALFGKASVEMCRDAVRGLVTKVPEKELPKSLQ